ncbi:hypothetical protein BDN72DRAFT_114766 [Pluteus cervinus]|uniref:Uncharacterized protein n=1 Tax=Pluteus cervinus TaxID=181527 RepID=A0ACD3AN03_9AGAR|nr:hypothetical protein BDN72DRAFT_114766 [Pluteus cervinus]
MAGYPVTIGALEIGVLISTFLFGIISFQTYIYAIKFPEDKWFCKAMVSATWLLELAHFFLVASGLFYITISVYFHPERDITQSLSLVFRISVLLDGFVTTFLQACHTERLHILSETSLSAITFWTLSALRLGGWVVTFILWNQHPSDISNNILLQLSLILLLAAGASIDMSMSLMTYYRFIQTKETLDGVSAVINRLMKWTAYNGFVTGFGGLSATICVLIMPSNFIWVTIFMVFTMLTSFVFLGTLNARQGLRRSDDESDSDPEESKSQRVPLPSDG